MGLHVFNWEWGVKLAEVRACCDHRHTPPVAQSGACGPPMLGGQLCMVVFAAARRPGLPVQGRGGALVAWSCYAPYNRYAFVRGSWKAGHLGVLQPHQLVWAYLLEAATRRSVCLPGSICRSVCGAARLASLHQPCVLGLVLPRLLYSNQAGGCLCFYPAAGGL